MPSEDITFQSFLSAKIKDRGLSLKKLSDVTGIAQAHLENMVHGKFDDLPSAPYFRGYIIRLGKALDFDGDAWWEKLKRENVTHQSGSGDALPQNRFIKKSQEKWVWAGGIMVALLLYLAFQLPILLGRPSVKIVFPTQNPFTTTSTTLTIMGEVQNANSLSLNGDAITIASDGSWQKTVLLQSQGGLNVFTITAKKLLGGETDVTQQIFYDGTTAAVASSTSVASSTQSSSTVSTSTR